MDSPRRPGDIGSPTFAGLTLGVVDCAAIALALLLMGIAVFWPRAPRSAPGSAVSRADRPA